MSTERCSGYRFHETLCVPHPQLARNQFRQQGFTSRGKGAGLPLCDDYSVIKRLADPVESRQDCGRRHNDRESIDIAFT
jgi:hypothetical protein